MSSPRASSTKTRIETGTCADILQDRIRVRGQVPQKQGLKPKTKRRFLCKGNVRGQVPQKQGLKHIYKTDYFTFSQCPRASSTKTRIETHHIRRRRGGADYRPRASSTKTRIETSLVSEDFLWVYSPRASSTKTRIETGEVYSVRSYDESPRASSTKTRIETVPREDLGLVHEQSEGKFHKNKD